PRSPPAHPQCAGDQPRTVGPLPRQAAAALPPRPAAHPRGGGPGRGGPLGRRRRADDPPPAAEALAEGLPMRSAAPHSGQSLALAEAWDGGRSAASLLASELRARWDRGEPPDTRAALADHPELGADRVLALDL